MITLPFAVTKIMVDPPRIQSFSKNERAKQQHRRAIRSAVRQSIASAGTFARAAEDADDETPANDTFCVTETSADDAPAKATKTSAEDSTDDAQVAVADAPEVPSAVDTAGDEDTSAAQRSAGVFTVNEDTAVVASRTPSRITQTQHEDSVINKRVYEEFVEGGFFGTVTYKHDDWYRIVYDDNDEHDVKWDDLLTLFEKYDLHKSEDPTPRSPSIRTVTASAPSIRTASTESPTRSGLESSLSSPPLSLSSPRALQWATDRGINISSVKRRTSPEYRRLKNKVRLGTATDAEMTAFNDFQPEELSFSLFDHNSAFGYGPDNDEGNKDGGFPVEFDEDPPEHIDHGGGQTQSFYGHEEEEDAGLDEDAPDDLVVLSSPDDEPTVAETHYQDLSPTLLLPDRPGGEPSIPCQAGLMVNIHFAEGWCCGHIQGFAERYSKWHFTFPKDEEDPGGYYGNGKLKKMVKDGLLFVMGDIIDPLDTDIQLAMQNSKITARDERAARHAALTDLAAQHAPPSPVTRSERAARRAAMRDAQPSLDAHSPAAQHDDQPASLSANNAGSPANDEEDDPDDDEARLSRTRRRPQYLGLEPDNAHDTQSTTSGAPHYSESQSSASVATYHSCSDIDLVIDSPEKRSKRLKTTHPVPEPDSQSANVSMAPPEPRPPQVQASDQPSFPLQDAPQVHAASFSQPDSQESSIHGSIPLSQVSTTSVPPFSQPVTGLSQSPNAAQYFRSSSTVQETAAEAFEEDDRHRTGLVISRELAVEYSCEKLGFDSYADFLAASKAYSQTNEKGTALCFCPGCKICDQIDSDDGQLFKCTNTIITSYRICKTCRANLPDSEAAKAFKSALEAWKEVSGNKATATGRAFRKASAEFHRNPTVATLQSLQEARMNYLCDTCSTWSTLCAVQGKNNEEMILTALNRVATVCPRPFMFLLGTWFTDGTIRKLHKGPHLGFTQCLYNIRLVRSFLISVRECNNVFQRTDFRVTKPGVRITIDFAGDDDQKANSYSLFHINVTKDNPTIPLKTVKDIEDFSRRLHLCSHDRWWETTRRKRTKASLRDFLKSHLGEKCPYWNQLEAHPQLFDDLVQTTHSNPIKGICNLTVHSWILILLEFFMLGHSRCLSIPNKDVFRCLQQRITFCHGREVMISCLRLFIIGAVAGDGSIVPYPFLTFADKRSQLDSIRWRLVVDPAHSGWLRGMIYKCFCQSMAIHIVRRNGKTVAELNSLGGIETNMRSFQIMRAELEKLFNCTAANPESGYDQMIIPFMKYETMAYFATPTPRKEVHQHFTGVTADWADGVTWRGATDTNSLISLDSVLQDAKDYYKVLLINRKKGEKLSAYPIKVKDSPMIDTSRTRRRRTDADADLIARRELHLKFAELRKEKGHFGLGENYRDQDFKRCKRFEIDLIRGARADYNIQLREYHCEEFPDEEYKKRTTVLGEPIFSHLHKLEGRVKRTNLPIPERHKDHLPYWETNQERNKRKAEEATATRK